MLDVFLFLLLNHSQPDYSVAFGKPVQEFSTHMSLGIGHVSLESSVVCSPGNQMLFFLLLLISLSFVCIDEGHLISNHGSLFPREVKQVCTSAFLCEIFKHLNKTTSLFYSIIIFL